MTPIKFLTDAIAVVDYDTILDCENVISICESVPEWSTSKTLGDKQNYRTSQELYLPKVRDTSGILLAEQLLSSLIMDAIRQYSAANEHLAVSRDTGINILKYVPGTFYKEHVDRGGSESNRVLTALLYLNAVESGGATFFPRQGIRVIPRSGRVLLFPSEFCFPHTSEELTSGSKYVAVTWLIKEAEKERIHDSPNT